MTEHLIVGRTVITLASGETHDVYIRRYPDGTFRGDPLPVSVPAGEIYTAVSELLFKPIDPEDIAARVASFLGAAVHHDLRLSRGAEAKGESSMSNENEKSADQSRFGTVEFEGVNYALIEQAQLTSRTFPGSWHVAAEGDEYQAEYGAQAVDASGNDFFVTWQFTETKGAETDDASNYDWSSVFRVVAR